MLETDSLGHGWGSGVVGTFVNMSASGLGEASYVDRLSFVNPEVTMGKSPPGSHQN
jgi:hypothetical protein